MWGHFLCIILQVFMGNKNIGDLLNITFIIDRCHHSLAVVTPVKYEGESKDLWGNYAKKHTS